MEDNYQLGISGTWRPGPWRLDLAFLKNPEPNSFSTDRYSFNVIAVDDRSGGSMANLKQINTVSGRVAYDWALGDAISLSPGLSAQYGSLTDGHSRQGNFSAYAAHLSANWHNWRAKLQLSHYDYHLNDAARARVIFGAFAGNYAAPRTANTLTGSVAWRWPVHWGPISALTFYNDYSRVLAKNDGIPNSWMNTTGFSIEAGPIFTYVDFVQAKNQPFVGGEYAPPSGTQGGLNRAFNINLGYYF